MRRHWTFEDVPNREVATWWNERPCNVQHSSEPIGSAEYFTDVAFRKYAVEPHLWDFIQDMGQVEVAFDAGCGIGTTTVTLSALATRVYAVDLSEESVKLAQQNVESRAVNARAVSVEVGDLTQAHDLHVKVIEPVDCIFSWGVIHHIPRPDLALAALRTVTHPSTELRLMVYNRWSTKAIRLGLTNRRVARGSEARPGSPVTYAFSRRQLRRVLRATGWKVERMWVDHIFPWDGDEYGRSGRLRLAFPWTLVPHWLFHPIERVLGWHLLVVARPAPFKPKTR